MNAQYCFALLDDCSSDNTAPSSRLYTGFADEIRCADPAQLTACWSDAEQRINQGLHAVLLADYDWGVQLAGITPGPQAATTTAASLRILLFRDMKHCTRQEVDDWLAMQESSAEPAPAGFLDLQSSVTREAYEAAIESTLEYIRDGETYQVNFTYRLRGFAFGSPLSLYRRLRVRQPVQFGALIALGTGEDEASQWILSCSPELFVRHQGGLLSTRPMKGTARRDADPRIDEQQALWLAADIKNRAENLMIVDLLRSDLGRVAEIGSVKTPSLFQVESYRTVHQMTSTVNAQLRPDVDFPTLLRAVFPCGSITGAPKYHTMELIARLESSPRGLYTGAIGWIDKPTSFPSCGDFCMSVAIRTIVLDQAERTHGRRPAELGIGGGIVLDSTPSSELEETHIKARFVTQLDPGFKLVESIAGEGRLRRTESHLERLASSARRLGFACDLPTIRLQLEQCMARGAIAASNVFRLELAFDGEATIVCEPRSPVPRQAAARVLIAQAPLPRAELALLGHKTNWRPGYDAALRQAHLTDAYDVLFFNAHGQLTEGARSNVLLMLDGQLWTPPTQCGLLPGIMRQRLLARGGGWVRERALYRQDLDRAQAIFLCNASHGLVRAFLGSDGNTTSPEPELMHADLS